MRLTTQAQVVESLPRLRSQHQVPVAHSCSEHFPCPLAILKHLLPEGSRPSLLFPGNTLKEGNSTLKEGNNTRRPSDDWCLLFCGPASLEAGRNAGEAAPRAPCEGFCSIPLHFPAPNNAETATPGKPLYGSFSDTQVTWHMLSESSAGDSFLLFSSFQCPAGGLLSHRSAPRLPPLGPA